MEDHELPHVHMSDPQGNEISPPEPHDVHGWSVLYQTVSCHNHAHRVLGWVGDLPSATKLSCVVGALWHPALRCTPTPAPTGDVPAEKIGVITDMPDALRDRVHAGEQLSVEELIDGGAVALHLHDEVMPEPVMIAVRVIEHLDAKGVDVIDLLTVSGMHNGMMALMRAGGEPMTRAIMKEFPSPDMSPGTGH